MRKDGSVWGVIAFVFSVFPVVYFILSELDLISHSDDLLVSMIVLPFVVLVYSVIVLLVVYKKNIGGKFWAWIGFVISLILSVIILLIVDSMTTPF